MPTGTNSGGRRCHSDIPPDRHLNEITPARNAVIRLRPPVFMLPFDPQRKEPTMRSRSIRTTTLVIPAVLLALAGCSNDDAAATMAPSSNSRSTDAIELAYKGAAGVAGAASGNYEPAFDSTGYVGAAGLAGAAAGNYEPAFDSTDYVGAAGVVGAAAGKLP